MSEVREKREGEGEGGEEEKWKAKRARVNEIEAGRGCRIQQLSRCYVALLLA